MIYLVLLFTVVPALELALLIQIGTYIGVGNTLMVIVLTGVLGAALARLQGFLILSKIRDELNRGMIPSSELIDGFLILVGGIVLLTPGFITDTMGFLLLIPWTRTLLKVWLRRKFEGMIRNGQTVQFYSFGKKNDDGPYTDIDV